jgi:hypothetical protein
MASRFNTVVPPEQYWAFNPWENPNRKLDTPVDERGIVDVPKLIQAVRSTVDPEYNWMSIKNVHHLYYEEDEYPYIHKADHNPHRFRNLPTSKILAPIDFHGWAHEVMVKPEPPSDEIMAYRIDAWNVARRLFNKAREVVQTEKHTRRRCRKVAEDSSFLNKAYNGEDVFGAAFLKSEYEANFIAFAEHLKDYKRIPEEFHVVDLANPESPRQVATDLGYIAVKRAIVLPYAAYITEAA